MKKLFLLWLFGLFGFATGFASVCFAAMIGMGEVTFGAAYWAWMAGAALAGLFIAYICFEDV